MIGTVCNMPSGTGRSAMVSYMESSSSEQDNEVCTCVLATWLTMPRSPSLATRSNRLGAVVCAVEGRLSEDARRVPMTSEPRARDARETVERESALVPRWLTTCRATAWARKSFWRPVSSACSSCPGSPQGRCSSRICNNISLRLALVLCMPLASQTSETSRATRPTRRRTSPSKSASNRGSSSLFMACRTMATLFLLLPGRMIGMHRMLRVGTSLQLSAASWKRGSLLASATVMSASVATAAAARPLPRKSAGSWLFGKGKLCVTGTSPVPRVQVHMVLRKLSTIHILAPVQPSSAMISAAMPSKPSRYSARCTIRSTACSTSGSVRSRRQRA
mmetsp:Transcript_49469/g.143479  ORF Transcript_49469/g.143479 Transcript_49469/m.143479 type:complete len:334 (-) Transcript_49469:833-1834(-)